MMQSAIIKYLDLDYGRLIDFINELHVIAELSRIINDCELRDMFAFIC
jgi:hypothetical protein